MRVACIDIGSNTTRLLVAEGGQDGALRPVAGARAFTGGHPWDEVAAEVSRQVAAARAAGATRLRVVGTAALRAAGPGALAVLREHAAVPVELLDAGEEGRLAFAGAARHHEGDEYLAVVDVGGGSTEVALGYVEPDLAVVQVGSVPLGSASLTRDHLPDDPPPPAQLQAAGVVAAEALREAAGPGPLLAFAAGGSAQTLGRICGSDLSPAALDRVLAGLVTQPAAEVATTYGIAIERARLLPAGLLLLRGAGEALGAPLRLGAGGLREGVCLDLLAQMG